MILLLLLRGREQHILHNNILIILRLIETQLNKYVHIKTFYNLSIAIMNYMYIHTYIYYY